MVCRLFVERYGILILSAY